MFFRSSFFIRSPFEINRTIVSEKMIVGSAVTPFARSEGDSTCQNVDCGSSKKTNHYHPSKFTFEVEERETRNGARAPRKAFIMFVGGKDRPKPLTIILKLSFCPSRGLCIFSRVLFGVGKINADDRDHD